MGRVRRVCGRAVWWRGSVRDVRRVVRVVRWVNRPVWIPLSHATQQSMSSAGRASEHRTRQALKGMRHGDPRCSRFRTRQR